jgi:hypothetical protein
MFLANGSLLMAPLFPRPGPGESSSPMTHSVHGGQQLRLLCAGHAQQFGGESPLLNLMEVKA